ncbi:hypothetical protein N431DRAFT_484386 [Stipitochalara longipes BDJ]|nr:hypothetical protein N431DRAFT_484386 [Stipitochalara longipes BDJ]
MGRTKARFGRPKTKVSAKKSLQKDRLQAAKIDESSNKKSYKKLPGFDAFNTQAAPRGKKKGPLVVCREATPPETGIHSFEWAAAIVPQSCGFLRLPFEVRRKIYDLMINDFAFSSFSIEPRKNGNKFLSPYWPNADQETTALYQLCRQTYVDVVGSGLLYSAKTFLFRSPTLMLNYLWVINPVHKDAIRSIELWISFRHRNKTLPSKALEFLAGCKGLRHLALRLDVDSSNCQITRMPGRYKTFQVSEKLLIKIREWDALRQIKGLLSFELRVFTGDEWWTPGAKDRYHQLEEDLRGALLKE